MYSFLFAIVIVLFAIRWIITRTRPMTQVKASPIHEYGVFAGKELGPGTLVDSCPTLQVPQREACATALCDYVFEHPEQSGQSLVAWGNCSLYNHSDANNAEFSVLGNTVQIRTTRRIPKGEEITISYGPKYWKSRGLVPK